jgi:hypothetical protein
MNTITPRTNIYFMKLGSLPIVDFQVLISV